MPLDLNARIVLTSRYLLVWLRAVFLAVTDAHARRMDRRDAQDGVSGIAEVEAGQAQKDRRAAVGSQLVPPGASGGPTT